MIMFTDGYADKPVQHLSYEEILWVFTSEIQYIDAEKWIKNLNGSKGTFIPSVSA